METPHGLNRAVVDRRKWIFSAILLVATVLAGSAIYGVPRLTDFGPLVSALPSSIVYQPVSIVLDGNPWDLPGAETKDETDKPRTSPSVSSAGGATATLPEVPTSGTVETETWELESKSSIISAEIVSPRRVISAGEYLFSDAGPFGPKLAPLVRAEVGTLITSYERSLLSFSPDGRLLLTALKLGAVSGSQLVVTFNDENASVAFLVPRRGARLFSAFLRAVIQLSARKAFSLRNGSVIIEARIGRSTVGIAETEQWYVIGSTPRSVAQALIDSPAGTQTHKVKGDVVISICGEGRLGGALLRTLTGSERYQVAVGVDLRIPSQPKLTALLPPARIFSALSRPVPISLLRSIPHDVGVGIISSIPMPLSAVSAQWVSLARGESSLLELPAADGVGLVWDINADDSVAAITVAVPSERPDGVEETFWRKDLPRGSCGANSVQIYATTTSLYQSIRESCDGASLSLASSLDLTAAENSSQLVIAVQPSQILAGIIDLGTPKFPKSIGWQRSWQRRAGANPSSMEEVKVLVKDLIPLMDGALSRLPAIVFSGNKGSDGFVWLTSRMKSPKRSG